MKSNITFLFYHYGKIPKYLECAIEHVRLFNPWAEIYLITDAIKNTSKLNRFDVIKFQLDRLTLFMEIFNVYACQYHHYHV
jgi:hypothetical protein